MNAPPLRPETGPGSDPGPDARADTAQARRWLSALADGEVDAVAPGCTAWRDDAEARRYWHTVHLIGDVLRSDELARAPSGDAAFLASLRERLAQEPVPLAPAAVVPAGAASTPSGLVRSASLRSRLGWRTPAAVAAGFAAVAVMVVVTRGVAPGDEAAGLAAGALPSGVVPVAVGGGTVQLRDPRLDAQLEAYLRAHQAARGGAAAALPGGALRNAEMVVVPMGALEVARPGSAGLPAGGSR